MSALVQIRAYGLSRVLLTGPTLRSTLPTPRLVLSGVQRNAAYARSAFSSSPSPREEEQAISLTDGEQLIKSKLESTFEGSSVRVQDVSGGCGTFYAIEIVHPSFKGKPMIKQHRMVQDTLKDDITGMHGLQIRTAWK